MRLIGINALHVHQELAGVRVYAANFIKAISEELPGDQIYCYTSAAGKDTILAIYPDLEEAKNVEFKLIAVNPRRKFLVFLAENTKIANLAQRHKLSILISLDYHGPLWGGRRSIVVHDINYIDEPDGLPFAYKLFRRITVPLCAAFSDQVWTISPFTLNRFREEYPRFRSKLRMVGSGVPETEISAAPLQGFADDLPFMLSVGTFNYNKNYDRLVDGFSKLNWHGLLVIVGKRGPASDSSRLKDAKIALGERLVILDQGVSDEELNWLYSKASAYVTSSLYEGYGLTILEAMRSGVPVAASNRASLPYVGGAACIYFDPTDTNEISATMKKIIYDDELREVLKLEAEKRLADQSWKNVARRVERIVSEIGGAEGGNEYES